MTVSPTSGATTPTSPSTSTSSASTSPPTTSGTSATGTIDWNALIEAAVDAKKTQATQITTQITANQAKITAYTGLQTALTTLATDLSSLSNSIINPLSTSAYAQRKTTISAPGLDPTGLLDITSKPGTATGPHTLTISQIATAQKVTTASQSSQTAALGYSGTFSLGLAGGDTADFTVTSGMSLQDVADAINNQTSTTNVQASIVQVSSNSFQLVLTGTEDAADITYSSTSGDDVLNKLGMTDSSGAFTPSSVLQAAQPAEFTLDGVPLTRNTNDIEDVLSGVTFTLSQPPPSGTILNFDIEPDTDGVTNAIGTFLTDYNAFRNAVLAQEATNSDGTAAPSAVLFGDSTMRSVMDQMQSILSTAVGGVAIGNIGLEFDANNNLVVGTDTADSLQDALSTNLGGIIKLLAAQTTSSSSQLAVVNTNSAPPSFTLDVQVDASGNLTSASVNGDSSLFTIDGNNIVGASGTIYSGMAFSYAGNTSQSIAVTSSSGIAAQLVQAANQATDKNTGSLTQVINSLTQQDTSLQSQVDDIDASAAIYQSQLETQYASYQSAIQGANNTMAYLKALLDAGSNN